MICTHCLKDKDDVRESEDLYIDINSGEVLEISLCNKCYEDLT